MSPPAIHMQHCIRIQELWLLDELKKYSSFQNFEESTAKLGVPREVHETFRKRIEDHVGDILSDTNQVLLVLREFEAFLNLGMPWHGKWNFCPSLIIDLVWHSAMQDAQKYQKIYGTLCIDALCCG